MGAPIYQRKHGTPYSPHTKAALLRAAFCWVNRAAVAPILSLQNSPRVGVASLNGVVLTGFTVDIQTIAAVLGILAVVCSFGLWVVGKVGNRLSPAEIEILIAAAEKGEIRILECSATGPWVRADKRDFAVNGDPAYLARYNEAFQRIYSRGYAVHQGGILYTLTGSGFELARKLKASRK